jgi:hypothetical protein
VQRSEVYLYSFCNHAINIIFGQLHAPGLFTPEKKPIAQVFESENVVNYALFLSVSTFWQELCYQRQCWGCRQNPTVYLSTCSGDKQWKAIHGDVASISKIECYCLHINSRLGVQWEVVIVYIVGAKCRFAPTQHSSGTSLRLNCYVSFQKDQACAIICTSTLVSLPNICVTTVNMRNVFDYNPPEYAHSPQ